MCSPIDSLFMLPARLASISRTLRSTGLVSASVWPVTKVTDRIFRPAHSPATRPTISTARARNSRVSAVPTGVEVEDAVRTTLRRLDLLIDELLLIGRLKHYRN